MTETKPPFKNPKAQSTDATEVKLCELSKTFTSLRGRVEVLKSIDLSIKPGELFVLLGPSGCGKSTTLNLIAGLEKPTGGTIHFSDKCVVDAKEKIFLAPFERDISFVFQSYAIYPHMTIEQNIEFPLTNLKEKLTKQERLSKVRETAKILQIEDLLDRKPSELSGGQRQRVAIGRAIVRNPSLFLMDEPLSNLDAKLRTEMRAELKAIQQKLGITTVYVTHDQIEAMTLGDRIAILDKGILQQIGSPDQIYSSPRNIFVASFIGSPPLNLIEGTVQHNDEDTVLQSQNLKIKLSGAVEEKAVKMYGKKVVLGIRPEAISFTSEEKADTSICFTIVENLGPEYLLHAFLDGAGKFTMQSRTPVASGTACGLKLDMNRLHLFDPETKTRI
ncbi:ABC transporter ATP-binding protein [Chitinispirillales bacterium ANBcel5]|uniref:ABC transporter ATP-binding protein n=1 Tax=Cellulosispirillum alkaliphilum TaxID=3039283 RepID=UPI002A569C0A|nr:ABC transporter ATP-binding protein [Chitinispirillales bacterium ANBcel5]